MQVPRLERRWAIGLAGIALLGVAVACSKILGIEPAQERPVGGDGPNTDGAIVDGTGGEGKDAQPEASCKSDTQTDPKNCGACGRDCRGGKCEAGTCTPVVLLFGQTNPTALAVTNEGVYWVYRTATGSGVRRCDLDGCGAAGPRTLFEQENTVYTALFVVDDKVYALRNDRLGIDQCNILGCNSLYRFAYGASAFSVGSTTAGYVIPPATSSSAGPGVWKSTLPYGTGATRIADAGSWVASAGSDIFVLDQGSAPGSGKVFRCTGGSCASPATFASGLYYAWPRIVASPYGVGYIAHASGDVGSEIDIFLCEPKSCAGGPRALAKIEGYLDTFAYDATYLYWANTEYSTIERVPWKATKTNPQVLLAKQGLPAWIALHDGALYYTRQDFGDIIRWVPPP